MRIREKTTADRPWAQALIVERWGGEEVVVHGDVLRPAGLAGFVAEDADGTPVGMATCALGPAGCEIVTLDSLREGRGVGSALVTAVVGLARKPGCARVWLITTNDNIAALRFYQRRGFRIAAVDRDAVGRSRAVKPSIPPVGASGIRILDEIELELVLGGVGGARAQEE